MKEIETKNIPRTHMILAKVCSYYKMRYSTFIPWSSKDYYNELMKILGNVLGQKILDIGFGYGEMLARILMAGGEAYGIEIVKEAVEYAKKMAPKAVVKLASAENMPFNDDFFDIALCSGVIEHFIDINAGLKEIHRVLKPSGSLIAVIPNKNWIGKLYKIFGLNYIYRIMHKLPPDQPIEREFTFKLWLNALNRTDFLIEWWKHYNVDLRLPLIRINLIKADQIPPALCYHFIIKAKVIKRQVKP